MGKEQQDQPLDSGAKNPPAIPETTRPTVSDNKAGTTVADRPDVEEASCQAGNDVDWEKGVPGRKAGTKAEASELIEFWDSKEGAGRPEVGDGAFKPKDKPTDVEARRVEALNRANDTPPQTPRLEATKKSDATEPGKVGPVPPEVGKQLEQYRAVLQLMDNFKAFDANPADKAITLNELKNFKSNNPEEQKAATFAINNFDKLSGGTGGGTGGITRDSLKQPLIESLTGSIKASKGDTIHPAVKEALASWIMMPSNDETSKYLEDKINKNLEGSGKKVTISNKEYPDYAGTDVPVTTVSIQSDKGVDKFSYTPTEVAKESLIPGAPMKGGLTLLDSPDPAKTLGTKGALADQLAKFQTLKSLKEMASFSDHNHDGLFTKSELDAVKPFNGKDEKAKDFATKNFEDLAKTAPTGDKLNINLGDKSKAPTPELQKDLDFLAKVFPHDSSVTIEQIKRFAKAAEDNQQSPLAKGFSEWNKGTNPNRQAEIEKQTKERDSAKATAENFDALLEKYGSSKTEGSTAKLRDLLDKKAITDPKLEAVAKELKYSGRETFTKEELEKSVKALQEKTNLYGFEKDQLATLQYGVDNFDKLLELTNPKEPSIQLSKIPADGDNAFLSDKNVQYRLDKDRDGRITKAEIEAHVKSLDKEIKTGTDAQTEEQKLYKEAAERFKSIIANSDALVKATGGDAPAISSADVDNAMLDSLTEVIKASAGDNGVNIPKALEKAIHDGISTRDAKQLEAAQKRMNEALKGSGYQIDLSIAKQNGPHGDSVRKMTFNLIDTKNNKQGTYSYSYDTLRS